MKINLNLFEETLKAETEFCEALKLPASVKSEIALDTVHGLNDLTRSLADLHPHKRSIATLGALPEPLSKIVTSFAGMGYSIQEIPVSFLINDEAAILTSWSTLKKDTLFVLCSHGEPLTGALYPVDFIRGEALKKSIFTLIYQSPDALKKGMIIPENPFEGVVIDPLWGTTSPLTLILKGERCQGERLLWGHSRYDESAVKILKQKILAQSSGGEDKVKVVEFENQMKMQMGHSVHFLGDKISRLFDRAVIFIDGIDGEALTSDLKKKNIESFTASACAWQSPHLNPWLPRLGIGTPWVQSSLILPVEQINKETLKEVISAIQALRKISGFEI